MVHFDSFGSTDRNETSHETLGKWVVPKSNNIAGQVWESSDQVIPRGLF